MLRTNRITLPVIVLSLGFLIAYFEEQLLVAVLSLVFGLAIGAIYYLLKDFANAGPE